MSKKSLAISSKKQNPQITILAEEGNKIDVPVEGSLGLLALGAVGLFSWRKKRKESKKADQSNN